MFYLCKFQSFSCSSYIADYNLLWYDKYVKYIISFNDYI